MIPDALAGVWALRELLGEHAPELHEVIINIDDDRGPPVTAMLAAHYCIRAINPMSGAIVSAT